MKFVEKKKVGWPGPAGNGYNARRGGVIKFLQMSVAKRWLCAAGRRCTRGRGGNEKSRRQKREGKKKEKERKKRRRAGTPPRGGVVSVPALSILLSSPHPPLPSAGGCTRVPRIQTNKSGSYRRSNKCRTFTFSSEGGPLSSFSLPSLFFSFSLSP